MRKTLCVLLAALAFGGLVFSEAQAMHAGKPHRYVVILIDQFPGHPENGAKAVNASGTVVGWSGVHDGEASIGTGFRWTPTTLDFTSPFFYVSDNLRGYLTGVDDDSTVTVILGGTSCSE